MRRLLLIACLFLLPACTATSQASEAKPRVRDEVRRACIEIMGFSPGETHYDGCVESLTRTVAGMEHGRALQADRVACVESGNAVGTRDFAVCVTARKQLRDREL
jgi:hypothetical protein